MSPGDPAALPREGRLLAVDPGTVRTGLALSDPGQTIATPLEVLAGLKRPALIEAVAARVSTHGVTGVVLGLPTSLDGQLGPMARGVLKLARRLADRLEVPVVTLDERYTSQAADRAFIEAGVRASDRRGRVDKVAAAILLQAYLDGRGPAPRTEPTA